MLARRKNERTHGAESEGAAPGVAAMVRDQAGVCCALAGAMRRRAGRLAFHEPVVARNLRAWADQVDALGTSMQRAVSRRDCEGLRTAWCSARAAGMLLSAAGEQAALDECLHAFDDEAMLDCACKLVDHADEDGRAVMAWDGHAVAS